MSKASECVYAVTNEWIIVDTDGCDVYPFIHPWFYCLVTGRLDYSLSVNYVVINRDGMGNMFIPVALIIIIFNSPGILFFCEGC